MTLNPKRRASSSFTGQVLVGAIVLLLVLVIIVFSLVQWAENESRWSVKGKRATTAFHLAEAAVDRGRWKLQETGSNWTQTAAGTLSNYNFDKAFADVSGGTYAIKISSDPAASQRRIVEGVGRDSSNNEVRRIRAVFERQTLDSAIWSGGELEIDGNSEVHWAAVKSQDEMDLDGAAASLGFPRKYARGEIDPLDTNAAAPNTDNVEYWAFFDVPPRPIIDFDSLKSSAQANGTYFSTDQDWNNAYPGGSCSGCPAGVSAKLDDNLVWYFEKDLRLRGGKHIIGTLIVMEELRLEGSAWSAMPSYTVAPPSQANLEYEKIDTSAADQWYGDAGGGPPSTVSGSFTFGAGGGCHPSNDKATCTTLDVSVRGFIYAKEEFDAQGTNVIHGIILVDTDEVENSGTVIVFYESGAAANVPIANATTTLVEWKEVSAQWPSGL